MSIRREPFVSNMYLHNEENKPLALWGVRVLIDRMQVLLS